MLNVKVVELAARGVKWRTTCINGGGIREEARSAIQGFVLESDCMRPIKVKLTAKNIYNPPKAIMFVDGSQPAEQVLDLIAAGLYGTPDPAITLSGELDGSPYWMGFADYHFDGILDIDITGWAFEDLMKYNKLVLVLLGPTEWRFAMHLSDGEPPSNFEIPMVASASGKVIPALPSSLIDAANRAADGLPTDPSLSRPLASFANNITWKPFFLPFCNQYLRQVQAFQLAGYPSSWVRFSESIVDEKVHRCATMISDYLHHRARFLKVGADGDVTPTALKGLLEFDAQTSRIFKDEVGHGKLPRIQQLPDLQRCIATMTDADLLIQTPAGLVLTDRANELLEAAQEQNIRSMAFWGPLTEVAIQEHSDELNLEEFPVAPRESLHGSFSDFAEDRISDFPDFPDTNDRPVLSNPIRKNAQIKHERVRFPGERIEQTDAGRVVHLHLRMALKDVKPTVSRVLRVPAHLSVAEAMPDILKLFGWAADQTWRVTYTHEKRDYTIALEDKDIRDSQYVSPNDIQLAQVFAPKFRVHIGYGSNIGWEMEVLNTGSDSGPHSIKVLKAKNACPPEDCEGPSNYQQLRDIRRQGAGYLKRHPNTPRNWFEKEQQLAMAMRDPKQPQYPAGYEL
ncbi:Plasmid pRiA4b ORF-3-like protein [Corynebacterium freiburgense]|nr:Plasmid pRiA4b ORF-3-like protein [Corynebacterium freiburgense]